MVGKGTIHEDRYYAKIDGGGAVPGGSCRARVALGGTQRRAVLRSFVKLKGDPTVLVTCQPTKNPDMSNLLPRGGGAFLAEIDGNLVAIREHGSPLVEITTHGKFRGPEFEPFAFKLVAGTSEQLKDSRGRLVWTVSAQPVGERERAAMENAGEQKRDQLLFIMKDRPASSIAELATAAGWAYKNGDPNRSLVYRLLGSLKVDNLVEKKGQRYVITTKGKKAVDEAAGGTYQARRDTARAPGSQDWICLATAGAGFTVRGTYDSAAEYHYLDVRHGQWIELCRAEGCARFMPRQELAPAGFTRFARAPGARRCAWAHGTTR